jgi:hypothetical protein
MRARLTDDEWKMDDGKCDQLVGKIQERYGITREELERQMGEFETTYSRAWLATDDRVCIRLDPRAGGPKLRHSRSG